MEFEAENLHWVKLVIEFFELHYMAIIEKKKAARIERFFCNIRRLKIKQLFNDYIYRVHGFSMSFEKLPRGVALLCLSYLNKQENLSLITGVSTRLRSLA